MKVVRATLQGINRPRRFHRQEASEGALLRRAGSIDSWAENVLILLRHPASV